MFMSTQNNKPFGGFMNKAMILMAVLLLTGCAKGNVFGSQHASLTESDCIACLKKGKPFYEDGVWYKEKK